MRLIEKLIAKRDAAYADYQKWAGMVEVLQNDPDFISVAHFGATKVMQQAHALANGNGNGHETPVKHHPNGNGNYDYAKHSAAARKGWTPERKALYSQRMKKRNPMRDALAAKRNAAAQRKTIALTPAQRKASSDRMKARRADPASEAKRLKALRKALKAKRLARGATTQADAAQA